MCLAKQADQDQDRLILEIGNASGSLFIVSQGNLQLIRSFPIPVESDKRNGMLGASVQRTLAAYDELCQTEFRPPDMVVTGAGLNGAGLDNDVSKVLDMPVNRLNFADRLNVQIDSENKKTWNPALMDNALALTMMAIEGIKGLNFHKDHFAAKKLFLKYKKYWIKTGILAVAVLMILFSNAFMETYTINRKLDLIDQQITETFKETFPDSKRIVDPHREMQIKVQEAKKSAVNHSTVGPHIRSIDILNSISRSIPEGIEVDVTRLVISPENVLISGNTDDFKSVDDIKSKLEQVEYFKKVTISSSNLNRSDKGVRFQLKVEL
jgi:Tfp pilus assembly protein PilN